MHHLGAVVKRLRKDILVNPAMLFTVLLHEHELVRNSKMIGHD